MTSSSPEPQARTGAAEHEQSAGASDADQQAGDSGHDIAQTLPVQWRAMRDAPVVRADGVPMRRRRTGRRVRGADAVPPSRSRGMRSARDAATVVMVALLISFVSQHVLVSGFLVNDDAMEPTLRPGDRVFANVIDLTVMGADRGEIIVFHRPKTWEPDRANRGGSPDAIERTTSFFGLSADSSTDHDIKRVVGVGGDRVSCCDAQGRIMVNEVSIDEAEAYLYPGEIASDIPFDVIVPDDQYFVLGDYRSVSSDSRHRLITDQAFVSHDLVEGSAFVVGWPLDRMGPLPDGQWVFGDVGVSARAAAVPWE